MQKKRQPRHIFKNTWQGETWWTSVCTKHDQTCDFETRREAQACDLAEFCSGCYAADPYEPVVDVCAKHLAHDCQDCGITAA